MAADTHLVVLAMPALVLILGSSLMMASEIYHEVRFVEMPQYSVALPGDSVYFSCATNLPTSLEEITWLHNGQVLKNQQDKFHIDKGQLTFKISTDPLVYKSQEGSYQCIGGASGSKFKIASIAAELNIAFLEDFQGQEEAEVIEIFEGNDAVIPCQVPESVPPAFVHFLRNDQENNEIVGKILNGDTLLLQNTSLSMNGNYTCVASNHITNQRKKSRSVISLIVQNATGKNEKSRMIYSPKDNYEVRVGENLHIPCTASGVPTPEIIWSKMINGVFSQVNHTSGLLQFNNISSNDSGHYMCAVFNGGRRYVRRTTVSVVVPPQHVIKDEVYLHVREGDSIELPCQASGSPPPFILWRFNGQPVSGLASATVNRITGKLVILNAMPDDHTGFYQCFARNKAGEVVAQAFVQVGEDILRDNSEISDYDQDDQELLETTFQDFQGHVVVSPTRPNVTQVNPESIIIRWELKKPEDYSQPLVPVKFFKIQFREFFRGGKGRSAWRTVEEDIDPFNRAFEIFGLHSDRKYRFRIIVVYENNDSQTSALSRKFRLNANFGANGDGGADLLSPRPKPPAKSPQILGVVPLGPTSLRLGWALDNSANEEVEGYFIFFKPSFQEKKFKKVTIIGATSHSHIIEALIPGMEYAIKVQAFNLAGASPSSKLVQQSTNPLPPVKEAEVEEELTTEKEISDQVEVDKDEEIVKYLIVGGSLAGTFVTLIILCYVLDRCRRYKKMPVMASRDHPGGGQGNADPAEIHDKFNDTAVQISNHHQSFSNSHLDPSSRPSLARSTQSFLTTKDSAINSNSNFEMSLLPNGSTSRDGDHHQGRNYSLAASDSVYSYSNSQSSLGQEYSAEPKSWRRSRKCEELTNGFI